MSPVVQGVSEKKPLSHQDGVKWFGRKPVEFAPQYQVKPFCS